MLRLSNPLGGAAHVLTVKEIFAAVSVLLLSLAIAFHRSSVLPSPIPADAPVTQFSEHRARQHLQMLLSFGPQRTVGSEANEIHAPKYILEQVDKIRKETGATIDVDRQYGSGSFSLDFLGGFTSVYENVQNVLVMLHSKNKNPKEGVLMLSAHYDSPVGTRGASDNAANVANMLEILRIMAFEHEKLPRSVLFMFTGAEETILQGSHMFAISGHKYVNYVKAFINLEAAGSGGRELMFQATNNQMARAWARMSPYPHGSIVGQEVFQSGIIPSDTDFRMYVAEMGVPGMDWANVENGQNYHTILDSPENIDEGSMQRYGENILETAREVLRDDALWKELAEQEQERKALLNINNAGVTSEAGARSKPQDLLIFFDFLGYFVVVIPPFWAFVFAGFGSAVLIVFFRSVFPPSIPGHEASCNETQMEWEIRRMAVKKLFQMLVRSVAYPLVTALIVHVYAPLCYYSRPWLAVPLYIAPALYGVASCFTTQDVDIIEGKDVETKRPSPLRKELLSFAVSVGVWTVLAVILFVRGKGSAYLGWVWAVIPVLTRMVHAFEFKDLILRPFGEFKRKQVLLENKTSALVGTALGSLVPILLTLPLLLVVLKFFIPITGRSGSRVPGDAIVGVVCGLCTFLLCLVPSSLLLLLPNRTMMRFRRALLYVWFGGMVLALLLRLLYGPGQASFSKEYPKRIYAIHVDALSHRESQLGAAESSYVWIIDADSSNSEAVIQSVFNVDPFFEVNSLEIINCDEAEGVYCNTPWFLPLKNEIPRTAKIPAKKSAVLKPGNAQCSLTLEHEEPSDFSADLRRLYFCLQSSERANIYFKDQEHGGPHAWSFEAPLAPTGGHLYVLIANGKVPEAGNCFWVESPKQQKLQVAWACYYVEENHPEELSRFVKALPEWTTPVSFVSKWRDAEF